MARKGGNGRCPSGCRLLIRRLPSKQTADAVPKTIGRIEVHQNAKAPVSTDPVSLWTTRARVGRAGFGVRCQAEAGVIRPRTHTGEMMGIQATGRTFEYVTPNIGRFAGGKAAEH